MDNTTPVVVNSAPSPKSPPKYPDFCGRRRLQLEVQTLNREIGFVEDELQSLEGLQPVSRCCKEVEEFVGSNPDPLIPIDKKRQQSCHFWKWLRSVLCFPISQLCCHCCCQKSSCCRVCSCSNSWCCSDCKCRHPRCASDRICCQCKCAECSSFSCFESCGTVTGTCSCFRLPSCRTHCSELCRGPCSQCRRCWHSEISCGRMPGRAACDLSLLVPWRWCCCCVAPYCCHRCCREVSCPLTAPSCPDYSCGCIWSCPKCVEARPCLSCCSSKRSCITGCLC